MFELGDGFITEDFVILLGVGTLICALVFFIVKLVFYDVISFFIKRLGNKKNQTPGGATPPENIRDETIQSIEGGHHHDDYDAPPRYSVPGY